MKRYELKNGLTLLVDERKTDSVAMGILVKVGSNDERRHERGIAHFLEHMIFEGTTTKSSKKLTAPVENVGGEANATTTNERTFVYTLVPKHHIEKALHMLADMFQYSAFNQKSFTKEKGVILDEIKMVHDDPKAYQWVLFLQTLFKKNRTKNPVYGSMRNIKRLKRTDLINFYNKYYTTKNIIISIVGNVKNIKEKVENTFSRLSSKKVTRWRNPPELAQKSQRRKRIKKKTNQTYFILGYKTPPAVHKDVYTLDVIRAILDRGQSSWLFNEIRTKRGLAYAVGAAHEASFTFGYFAVFVVANKKHIPEIRNLVLEAYRMENITRKEVEDAKSYVEGSFILANEQNLERAERNAFYELINKTPREVLANIRKVSLADVKRVAKKYFHGRYTETIVEQKG